MLRVLVFVAAAQQLTRRSVPRIVVGAALGMDRDRATRHLLDLDAQGSVRMRCDDWLVTVTPDGLERVAMWLPATQLDPILRVGGISRPYFLQPDGSFRPGSP